MTLDSAALKAVKATLATIRPDIIIPDEPEVITYLLEFPDIAKPLPSVVKAARVEFPDDELSLEVYHDPGNSNAHLSLYVRMASYTDDITERIERIDDIYAEEHRDCEGWLLVTTDFSPPRNMV